MERVSKIDITPASRINHPICGIDENHLLFGNYIGVQYVFAEGLDSEVLADSISALITQFPALSGRYKPGHITPTSQPLSLEIRQANASALDFSNPGTPPPPRTHFISELRRSDVLKGRAPLSTFALTHFDDGSSIFGMAISHVLLDAAGFHLTAQRLAAIYSAKISGQAFPETDFLTQLPEFSFGTDRSKSDTLAAIKKDGLAKPIPLKGLMGSLVKSMIIRAMDKMATNVPVCLYFDAKALSRLKETVLAESGEDWISTNIALCTHLTAIMAELSYGEDLQPNMQIGQLLDLRNRYFNRGNEAQSEFAGNAILIHIDTHDFADGLQKTSRGALARMFKARQSRMDASDIKRRLDILADCLHHGFSNPGLDVKNPMIAINNQSKMPVYDIAFGDQGPVRVIPQDVGDNIMVFPARGGGCEIFIRDIVNSGDQNALLTPEWQSRIFNF